MLFSRWRSIVPLRLRSLFRGSAVDRALDEEVQFHVERQTEANIASGMTPDEARTAALRAFGAMERLKDECRDERGINTLENVGRDLRLGLRQLRKEPTFASAAIVSLALGIGANTAILQLLNAVTMRPLPVAAADELVEVRPVGGARLGRHTGRNRQWSQPQWIELQRRQEAFSSMAAFGDTRFNLAPSGEVRYVEGLWVSGSFFETLGVAPILGRLLQPSDDYPGCGYPGAVISYVMWQRDYGGRSDVLGQLIALGPNRVPILGVTGQSFFGVEVGRRFDLALPLCSSGFDRRDHWWLATLGRLKPGWRPSQAEAHLQRLIADVQRDTMPTTYRPGDAAAWEAVSVAVTGARTGVSPLRESYRQPLWVLMAIAALVLVIASVNLANLLLARATARRDEVALRLALGASRGRVVQQTLIESALLAGLGAAAAAGLAQIVSPSLVALLSTAVDPIYLDLSLDWRTFGLTALVAGATALIFGLAPAVNAARTPTLRPGGRGVTPPTSVLSIRRALVSLQIAVTLGVLVTSLLLGQSFRNLATEDIGVSSEGVLVANVFFPAASFPPEKRTLAYGDVERRLASLPGVTHVAEAFTTPIGGSFSDRQIRIDGQTRGESYANWISAGYFETLGTPLVSGRDIDAGDLPGAPRIAIVNEVFAEKFLDGNALGRRFGTVNDAGEPDTVFEVIGVVGNQKYMSIREPFPPIFYPASSQDAPGLTRRYVVRSTEPLASTIGQIGAMLAGVDPSISVRHVTLSTQIGDALLQDRLTASLAVVFGIVALALAIVGLYGVVAYMVTSRRAEIGVRIALGASRRRVLGMILRDVGWMLAVGLGAGAILALAASRAVGSLLYGVDAHDPAVLAMSAVVLALAGFAAGVWPAQSAAAADPSAVLREP